MKRAVVLGGGGPVGIAWETGVIAGLEISGIFLGKADYILGTSAGSMVGAQIAFGRSALSMVEAEMKQQEKSSQKSSRTSQSSTMNVESSVASNSLDQLIALMTTVSPEDPIAHRKKIGEFALNAKTMREESFLKNFQDVAGVKKWPENFSCTAINTKDGSFKEWNKKEAVDLQKAVTSSCAVPGIFPPITINGERYMDGGMASATNATLAKGYDVVVILSVMTDDMQQMMGNPLGKEVQRLDESGSNVVVISPDSISAKAFGPNLMDNSVRGSVAEAGLRQGKEEASKIREIWD